MIGSNPLASLKNALKKFLLLGYFLYVLKNKKIMAF